MKKLNCLNFDGFYNNLLKTSETLDSLANGVAVIQPVPMTNADRIRAMSDEELAELIVVRVKDIHHQGMRELAYSAWLEWLKKPAEKPKEDE